MEVLHEEIKKTGGRAERNISHLHIFVGEDTAESIN